MGNAFTRDDLRSALTALGQTLEARQLAYEVVLVGGASLLLRGIIERPTRDGDVLGLFQDGKIVRIDVLPEPFAAAVRDVADLFDLALDWINTGPASMLEGELPEGFIGRLEPLSFGSLRVWLASAYDLVAMKLWAAVDSWPQRDRHIRDLARLHPGRDELIDAARWTTTQDTSPGFRFNLIETLRHLGLEDADHVLD